MVSHWYGAEERGRFEESGSGSAQLLGWVVCPAVFLVREQAGIRQRERGEHGGAEAVQRCGEREVRPREQKN